MVQLPRRSWLQWRNLQFNNGVAQNLTAAVVQPVCVLASHTIDVGSILAGFLPGVSVGDRIAHAYKKFLYGRATLQDLPADNEGPRFVINATNVQTGALWRFSRPYMGDYKVGLVNNPTLSVASAVAASSAFPPVLSPVRLKLPAEAFAPDATTSLQHPPFTTDVVLTDGGVYDNLGLETAWKRCRTLLVSDGGGQMAPDPQPHRDWGRHGLRVNGIIDNQVRSLRKRQLIDALKSEQEHNGAYWGIRSHIADYDVRLDLECNQEECELLANTPTRLKALSEGLQHRIINWGYAICAAASQAHFQGPLGAPVKFPFGRYRVAS